MNPFVSTFTNKLDAKGRVSVPSAFRSILVKDGSEGVFCYPALDTEAVDAGGKTLVSQIQHLIEGMELYSCERDYLSTALFGGSEILKLDSDGRIVLPDRLKIHTGIRDQVTFVGLGDKFQMWAPHCFEAHWLESRNHLRERKSHRASRG